MNDIQLETLDQVRQFLEGSKAISSQIESKDARYRWLQHTFAYSGSKLPPIPDECCHPFHFKAATDSG